MHPLSIHYARPLFLRLAYAAIVTLMLVMGVACTHEPEGYTTEQRQEVERQVGEIGTTDSLGVLARSMEAEHNSLGHIVAMREWGKRLRNESQLIEALKVHQEGLKVAKEVNDTLEWVQALNNVGTDYRRLGRFDAAQEYHYQALRLCETCADTSRTTLKNKVVSLNGLGNIYLTMEDYDTADSVLRMALQGEIQLQSNVGQAINYANLGSIYEHRMMTDSAWVYYLRSMECNMMANNILGQALCHIQFGSLYEAEGRYASAKEEYEKAYELMRTSQDQYHAVSTLIRLAGIHHLMGNDAQALTLLGDARATAEEMELTESLSEIHHLYYKVYKGQGRSREALAAYEVATALHDSAMNIDKVNRINRISLNIVRDQHREQVDRIENALETERSTRVMILLILGLIILILVSTTAFMYYIHKQHRRYHAALQSTMTMRENFFTNITHEFRTPLTIILGHSHDLQTSEELPPDVDQRLQAIERQGRGLLTLINQLLDISKVKFAAGNQEWKYGNITAYLSMIIETHRLYAEQKCIELLFETEGALEMDFVPDYINKIFNNLLSNALKFTPEGGRIRVSMHQERHHLLVSVSDTGEGMTTETQENAFQPFYQGPSETKHLGTGIGLALVKQIVDALQGSIALESSVGRGTTFRISLPIHRDSRVRVEYPTEIVPLEMEAEDDYEAPALQDSLGDRDSPRLLIIEDNSDIAAYIGAQFAQQYHVAYAPNGKVGMEKALEQLPDLIITDLSMPGMDGLELCRQVRANEVVNHIPIIVVTANVTEQQRITGIQAGANAYLSKPFNSDELRTLVEKLLLERRMLRVKFAQSITNIIFLGAKGDHEDSTEEEDVDIQFVRKLHELLEANMGLERDANAALLREQLCMSYSQLHRKMKAVTGYAPSAYILRYKMGRAQEMIDANPDVRLQDVASQCGFEIYSSFSRAFKQVCGVSPAEYQESLLST